MLLFRHRPHERLAIEPIRLVELGGVGGEIKDLIIGNRRVAFQIGPEVDAIEGKLRPGRLLGHADKGGCNIGRRT